MLDDDISNTNGPTVAVLDDVMTLIIGDSWAPHYYRYDYEPTSGSVGPRSVFGDVTGLGGWCRTSTRPNVASTASNSAATAASSRTSVGTTTARASGRAARTDPAVSSSGSRRRPAKTRSNPSAASCTATVRPMPDPVPVTTATRIGPSLQSSHTVGTVSTGDGGRRHAAHRR